MTEKQRSQQDISRGSQSLVKTFEDSIEKVGKFIQSPEFPKGTMMSYFILHGPVHHITKRKVLLWIKVGN